MVGAAAEPVPASLSSVVVPASRLRALMRMSRSGGPAVALAPANTGAITTDGTYVYWTQNDGRVYRAPKQ